MNGMIMANNMVMLLPNMALRWKFGEVVRKSLNVVIVNPGVILGGGFWNEGSGKLFSQVHNGFKFYTEGVTGFVGVQRCCKSNDVN